MGARESILAAADAIFGEVGFETASTREIAEACSVNKALIHYHFGNKEGLLAAVLDRYYDRLAGEVSDALSAEGSVEERLQRLVSTYFDFLSAHQGFCRIVQHEASGGRNAALIRERMTPLFQLGAQLLQQHYPGANEGDLAAEQMLVSVYGMIVTYFTYADVLEPLFGSDPMATSNLAARKAHVLRMLEIFTAAVSNK